MSFVDVDIFPILRIRQPISQMIFGDIDFRNHSPLTGDGDAYFRRVGDGRFFLLPRRRGLFANHVIRRRITRIARWSVWGLIIATPVGAKRLAGP